MTNHEIAERLERCVGKAPGGWLYFQTKPSVEVVAAAAAALRAQTPSSKEQQ